MCCNVILFFYIQQIEYTFRWLQAPMHVIKLAKADKSVDFQPLTALNVSIHCNTVDWTSQFSNMVFCSRVMGNEVTPTNILKQNSTVSGTGHRCICHSHNTTLLDKGKENIIIWCVVKVCVLFFFFTSTWWNLTALSFWPILSARSIWKWNGEWQF